MLVYFAGKMPSISRCHDSEDTDGLNNSTIESFSAWDNYLVRLISTAL